MGTREIYVLPIRIAAHRLSKRKFAAFSVRAELVCGQDFLPFYRCGGSVREGIGASSPNLIPDDLRDLGQSV